ncbi:MAG: GNAT family N-acetyltransferase [Blastocatellia bacterium]
MKVCATERLQLRRFTLDDAAFILQLLNEPSFLTNIGDKGVRTVDDAREYLRTGPLASYAQHGFGLLLVELQNTPIGMCGILKRDGLDAPDIGYALLPRYWSQGYAIEAATAVLQYAYITLQLNRILAITKPDNTASIRVLEKLGFVFTEMVKLPGAATESRLFTFVAE